MYYQNLLDEFVEKNLTKDKVQDIVDRVISKTNNNDNTDNNDTTPEESVQIIYNY